MFDTVRSHRRILLAVILLLIMPAFVFFGVAGYDSMFGSGDDVAVVDGQPISRRSLDAAHQQRVNQLGEMAGGQLDYALFDTPQARRQTLEELITQQALLGQARKEKIQVADESVRRAIAAMPVMQGPDGKFDYDRYQVLLAQQGMSPAGFEAQMKQELALQMLGRSIQETAIVPNSVVDRIYAALEERRTVRVKRIETEDFEKGLEPTAEQIQAYYDAQGSRYELPEVIDIETVVFDRSAISVPEPSDEALRSYYQQNLDRFGEPEQRRASHILITADESDEKARVEAKARAEALLEKVKANPASFAEVARTESQDPGSAGQGGDLGYLSRDMMAPAFADVAFGMKEGEVTGPVASEFGYHLIELTGIKGSGPKPFEEVKEQIAATWREQEAGRLFTAQAEEFNNLVYEQSDTLQPAADRFKLEIRTVSDVTRRPSPGEGVDPASPLADERFRAALFNEASLEGKRNVEAMEIQPGRVASARVIAHRPASRQPLDAVRDEVRSAVILEEAGKLAVAEGERQLAAHQNGESQGGSDRLAGFSDSMTVTRTNPGSLSPQVMKALFALTGNDLPAFVGAGQPTTTITPQGQVSPGGYQLVALEKVEAAAADAEAEQRKLLFRQQIERQASQLAGQTYVEAVRSRARIERREGAL